MTDPVVCPSEDAVRQATEAIRDRCRWSTSYVRQRRAIFVLAGLSDRVRDALYDGAAEGETVFEDRWSIGHAIRCSPSVTTVQMHGEEPVSLPTLEFGRMLQSFSYSWSEEHSESEVALEATLDDLRQFLLRWNDRARIIRAANTRWRPLWLLRSRLERVRAAVYGGPHFYWDESLDPDYGDSASELDSYVLVIDGERASWRWQGEERTASTEQFLDQMDSLFISWLRLAELPLHPAGARMLSISFSETCGHLFSDGTFVVSDVYAPERLRCLAKRALHAALLEARRRPSKTRATEARSGWISELTKDDPQLNLLAEDALALGGIDDQLWEVVREYSPEWDTNESCWVISWQTPEGDEFVLPLDYNPGDFRDAEAPPTETLRRIIDRLKQRGWVCAEDVPAAVSENVSRGQRRLGFPLLHVGFDAVDD